MPTKKTGGRKNHRGGNTKVAKQGQSGGWFWEEKDPYFGGVVKVVKKVLQHVKPSQIANVASMVGIPYASSVSNGLKMVGLGENQVHDRNTHYGTTRITRYRNARPEHLEQNIPDRTVHYMSGTGRVRKGKDRVAKGILNVNSSSYGIAKF